MLILLSLIHSTIFPHGFRLSDSEEKQVTLLLKQHAKDTHIASFDIKKIVRNYNLPIRQEDVEENMPFIIKGFDSLRNTFFNTIRKKNSLEEFFNWMDSLKNRLIKFINNPNFSLRQKMEWLGCITFCSRMQEDRDDIIKYVYEESEKNDLPNK